MAVKNITPTEGKNLLASNKNIHLLDVRTVEEFSDGHIPGSVNIPVESLPDSNLTKDLPFDTKIIVYCHSGYRASQAANYLESLGYTDISNMGGIIDWPFEITK